MADLKKLYKDLKKYSKFDEDTNVEKFLETVDKIVSLQDSSCIKTLLEYFDDEREYSWVFEDLQNSIFCFPKKEMIRELMKNVKNFIIKSPNWCEDTFSIILNDENNIIEFKKNFHLVPENVMIQLIALIAHKSPHHKDLCNELKKELIGEYKE